MMDFFYHGGTEYTEKELRRKIGIMEEWKIAMMEEI
jgi:hypothetical protein